MKMNLMLDKYENMGKRNSDFLKGECKLSSQNYFQIKKKKKEKKKKRNFLASDYH